MLHEHAVAAAYWSAPRQPGKRRWWQSPTILQHINRLVCGEPLAGAWSGLNERLRVIGPFERGISVGCGNGAKEIRLVRLGIVERFDLFEISQTRAEQGRELATKEGVADRVHFHVCDAFEQAHPSYDLVYWNNALHHMLDTEAAVAWSKDRLMAGGVFVMDDFVGPNRHQWSTAELDIAEGVRLMLPPRYMRDPLAPEKELARRPVSQSVEEMMRRDPTEAANSEAILPAVLRYFPDAEVIPTGGVVYHLALNDVIANFTEDDDRPLLEALLAVDEAHMLEGRTHYAVALATK